MEEAKQELELAEAVDSETFATIRERLSACREDRKALREQIEPMLKAIWHDALCCLESVLLGSEDPAERDYRLFRILRHRLLNTGNHQVRELAAVLNNYEIKQVMVRQQVVHIDARDGQS